MRKTAFAGLFLCAVTFTANVPKVSASAPDLASSMNTTQQVSELALKAVTETSKEPAKDPAPVKHVVEKNQTLTGIAKQHDTTWKRLYDKNTEIKDPDVLEIGEELTVPLPDEKLKERSLPEAAQTETAGASPTVYKASYRGSTSGNGYQRGYCTWYAKERRSDLPNNLGNADTWVSRAAAQGIPTGSTPRVGAIGQQGMHVVYVERVNSNGTVTISEMNWEGWNVVSSRTVSASNFRYIY